MNTIIYDFETLSCKPLTAPAVSLAYISYDYKMFLDDPYTYDEFLDMAYEIKFDVEEQVKIYNRKIEMSTLAWWAEQSDEAQEILNPSSRDKSIDNLPSLVDSWFDLGIKRVYTRGNTFDPILLDSLLLCLNKENPLPYWTIRDTRSYIEGMLEGSDIKHNFIPDDLQHDFVAHDARHDVAMDAYRMQYLVRTVNGC